MSIHATRPKSIFRPFFRGIHRSSSGASLLLDTLAVQPAAAYSLRKLRAAYTGACIRVRRSSDNAEQDIGFVANLLDTTALTTFCGAGDGFVRWWYDQSTAAADIGQATAGVQPQIVASGVVVTAPGNGKPSLKGNTSMSLARADVLGGTSAEIVAFLVNTPSLISPDPRHIKLLVSEGNPPRVLAPVPFNDGSYAWDVNSANAGERVASAAGIAVASATDIITLINSASAARQEIWRNGVLIASDATGQTTATDTVTLMSGISDWTQEFFVFGAAGALAQRDAITRNRGAVYGVTVP